MENAFKIKSGIYLISPERILNLDVFLEDLKFILEKIEISLFQLRLKNISDEEVSNIINKVFPLCKQYNTTFILNDNLFLAKLHNCDGIHIGKEDIILEKAKENFKGLIGVSCYADINRALSLAKMGASYVSFGAFYKSPTKPMAPICPLNVIEDFRNQNLYTPICAIGGITPLNSSVLIKKGADLIAVSSIVWHASSNKERVDILSSLYSNFSLGVNKHINFQE